MTKEVWGEIEGYPNHKISSLGRLKSFGVKRRVIKWVCR